MSDFKTYDKNIDKSIVKSINDLKKKLESETVTKSFKKEIDREIKRLETRLEKLRSLKPVEEVKKPCKKPVKKKEDPMVIRLFDPKKIYADSEDACFCLVLIVIFSLVMAVFTSGFIQFIFLTIILLLTLIPIISGMGD